MKRKYALSIIMIEGMLFTLLFIVKVNIPCFFKMYFQIPCVGCGMTRSINALFHFQIGQALYYNILTIPLLIIVLMINFYLVYDIFYKKDKTILFLKKLGHNYKIILCLLVMTFCINVINGI